MSKMKKTFKNVFVLTIGIAIGIIISNKDKFKIGKQKISNKLKKFFRVDPFDDDFEEMFE